ncbi:uncharacterized protein LOC116168683 [Photinus pyralis]|uniref:uncharacterized protein LOC116168683 n=1 Tax=Photinus pyralis TaxID=7054 RepID=UPI001267059A|nr:uncharacterized protein LOC116168683 [Photinus pyralis]
MVVNRGCCRAKKEIYGSRSLKGVRLTVPRAVRAGHSVTLGCDYDLEDAPLYSVKWYRGTDEFYRYVPKEEPPTRVFPQGGLHVDVSVSNARKVTLLSVARPLSGVFQCEVSADAPLFHTEVRAAPMTVVDLQKNNNGTGIGSGYHNFMNNISGFKRRPINTIGSYFGSNPWYSCR